MCLTAGISGQVRGVFGYVDRKIAQLEKDLAAANGIIQATKEAFEEEKLKFVKELDEEREKSQSCRLKHEASIDQLQREVSKKGAGPDIIKRMIPEEYEEHTPAYYLTVILNDLKEKRKENDGLALKVEYDQKIRNLESDHQGQLSALKTQLKRAFNLDLQNLKLAYENQMKQIKISMKKQEENIQILHGDLVKKESEISLLREKTRHFENERKMQHEHATFLSQVI